MRVSRKKIESRIEEIIADGAWNGEEVDITAEKVMEEIEIIIRAAERWDGTLTGYGLKEEQ